MCLKCKQIKKLLKKTHEQLKIIEQQNDKKKKSPVDIDMVKTVKAMFYEKTFEIFKKGEQDNNV
jgi:hypothetical protein